MKVELVCFIPSSLQECRRMLLQPSSDGSRFVSFVGVQSTVVSIHFFCQLCYSGVTCAGCTILRTAGPSRKLLRTGKLLLYCNGLGKTALGSRLYVGGAW